MSDLSAAIRDAMTHQRAGRLDEAAAIYARIADDPAAPAGVLVNLGQILSLRGDAAGAVAALRKAIERDPRATQAYVNLGVVFQAAGESAAARACFESALGIDPDDREALANLGGLHNAEGRHAEALPYFERALARQPDWAPLRFNLALALGGLGRHAEALGHLDAAAALRPGHVETEIALANTLMELGRKDEAVDRARALCRARPDDPDAQFKAGIVLHLLKRGASAIEVYERAIALAPEVAEPHNNLAQALDDAGKAGEAREAALRAIALKPDFAEAWNTLGNIDSGAGRLREAVDAFRRALALKPGFTVAEINLAQQFADLGQTAEARAAIRRALDAEPGNADAWNVHGLIEMNEKSYEAAIRAFRRALVARLGFVNATNNLAATYQEMGRNDEALRVYRDLIATAPDIPDPYFNVAGVLQLLNRHAEAAEMLRKALVLKPDHAAAVNLLIHSMLHDCVWDGIDALFARMAALAEAATGDARGAEIAPFGLLNTPASPALLQKISRLASLRIEQKVVALVPQAGFAYRRPGRKLKVGYISPDFRIHSVAYAFAGLLDSHDRDGFEWHGYSTAHRPEDDMTRRLRSRFDRFAEIGGASPLDAARMIDADGVDLLIDLAGHTRGTGLGVLALRPAPVQAHYLGYGATIGARFVDYLVTDDWYAGPDLAPYFDEALVHLPSTMMATAEAEPDPAPVTRAEWGLPEGAVVFANFNAHHKFDSQMWDIWMRLLRRVEGSVLWMLEGSAESRQNLLREAAARDIGVERLIFSPTVPHPRHLARGALADLALDTRHHSGGVTTVDAMRIGLPVVTLPGNKPNGRTSASILAAMDAVDLIAKDEADYEAIAYRLATDQAFRIARRARLAAARATAPLFDRRRLARGLEYAFRRMIETRAAGKDPTPFRVPDSIRG